MKRQTVNEAARMGADSFYTNSATIPVLSYPRAGEAWRRAACSHSMESCTLSDWPCCWCCCCCCSNFLARRRDMRQTESYYNKQKIYRSSSRLSPLLWMFYAPFWNVELMSLLMWRKTLHKKKSHQITQFKKKKKKNPHFSPSNTAHTEPAHTGSTTLVSDFTLQSDFRLLFCSLFGKYDLRGTWGQR